MRESVFQTRLIRDIKIAFPGAVILKNDPSYIQGIPDWIILYRRNWAAIDTKESMMAPVQPNQEYYINLLDEMSFGRFVYPENKERVLDELQQALRFIG